MKYRDYLRNEKSKYFTIGILFGFMICILLTQDPNPKIIYRNVPGETKILQKEKVIYKSKPCKNEKHEYKSQSNEDKALYEQIFSKTEPEHGGIILEMGALDGKKYSISWFFETYLNWRSILIEANPRNFKKLVKNRPRSINIHTAICPHGNVSFIGNGAVGGAKEFMKEDHKTNWIKDENLIVSVPCSNFTNVFKRHSISGIDVFILDVEGGEYEALLTMDWNIPVGVFVIELSGGLKDAMVRDLLFNNGYVSTEWDIRDYCVKGQDCSMNECFVKQDI